MAVSGVNSSASNAARQAAEWAAAEQKQTAQAQGTTAAKTAVQNTTATKPASQAQPVDVFEAESTQQTQKPQGT